MEDTDIAREIGKLTQAIEDQKEAIRDLKTALKETGRDCVTCRGEIDRSIGTLKTSIDAFTTTCAGDRGYHLGKKETVALIAGGVVFSLSGVYSIIMIGMALWRVLSGSS